MKFDITKLPKHTTPQYREGFPKRLMFVNGKFNFQSEIKQFDHVYITPFGVRAGTRDNLPYVELWFLDLEKNVCVISLIAIDASNFIACKDIIQEITKRKTAKTPFDVTVKLTPIKRGKYNNINFSFSPMLKMHLEPNMQVRAMAKDRQVKFYIKEFKMFQYKIWEYFEYN